MDAEIKKQWLAALRSGKYKQGKNTLHNGAEEFCCLGVLCDLAFAAGVVDRFPKETPFGSMGETVDNSGGYAYGTPTRDRQTGVLPLSVQGWADLTSGNPAVKVFSDAYYDTLSSLNDSGNDFNFIADVIERSL